MRALLLILIVLVTSCSREQESVREIDPPVAPVQQTILTNHGHDRVDEYYWIRDDSRKDERVLSLLEAENAYTRAVMSDVSSLQASLLNELSSRLPTADRSVPIQRGDYLYFQEFLKGRQYPIYKRRTIFEEEETILLDANALANGKTYYDVGNFSVSPDHSLLAFAEDDVSRGVYHIRFKYIDKDEYLPDEISGVSPAMAWAADNKTIFYSRKDPDTLLPDRIFRHELGKKADTLVFEEADDAFYTSVYASRSNRYIVIANSSAGSSEMLLVDAFHPTSSPRVFLPRESGHEYRIRHHGNYFYVLSNWRAKNFRLMRVAEDEIGTRDHWEEVVAHQEGVLLEDFEIFDDYLVLAERSQGLTRIRVIETASGAERFIRFGDPAYSVRIHANPSPETSVLRYSYTSLSTPFSVFEYDMSLDRSSLRKTTNVVGEFDSSDYDTERFFFEARDGTEVPVSLVYRRDKFTPGSNPAYLYGYGAYGHSTAPAFQAKRLSLLDRGFVIAIVHVRGGREMGNHWYEQGRLLRKKNTFYDFIDGTRALIDRDYVDRANIFAVGASAGGLLMGVVANEAPEMYRGVIAHVPFVDVLTTMLDESIPLTSGEYTEWGDPQVKEFYEYMLSYSPYDQVRRQAYPNMLVTTGLYDSQVQYFEPVKWVSRLRRLKEDDNLLLLDVDMDTGHAGASDRYVRYRRDALEYAFILNLAGRP